MPIILDPPEITGGGTPPDLSPGALPSTAERLYKRWEPYWEDDAAQGYPLWYLAEALTLDTQEIDDIVRDTDDHEAWHILFDPNAAPAYLLAWMAQFVGVRLLPADTEEQQRSRIQAAAGFYRGTQRAIREEVQTVLTGAKTVKVLKTGAWTLTVVTRTAQTPDPAAAERAARRQKPAGVVLTYVTSDNPIWFESIGTWDDVATGVTWNSVTLADVT